MKNPRKNISRTIYSNLLYQFDLNHDHRGKPKLRFRHVNSLMVSLCLVSGLFIGISYAFAAVEKSPEQVPSDQPVEKKEQAPVKTDTKVEEPLLNERFSQESIMQGFVKQSPSSMVEHNTSEQDKRPVEHKTKQVSTLDVLKSSLNTHKTINGGKLPRTSGDDLNGVAIGGGMVFLGLFLLKKKAEVSRIEA